MSLSVEALTTASLSLALEAATRRQQAIAANIANVNTESYTPVRVSFEESLDDARQALQENGSVDQDSLDSAHIEVVPMLDAQGFPAKVQVDMQMVEMARNAVQYQALTQGLSRHLAILEMAAADGKK